MLLQMHFDKLDHSLCACLQTTSMPQQDEKLVHFNKKQRHHSPTFCIKKAGRLPRRRLGTKYSMVMKGMNL